jgi:hypothetical protein
MSASEIREPHVSYRELAERLKKHGLKEGEASVASKITRYVFPCRPSRDRMRGGPDGRYIAILFPDRSAGSTQYPTAFLPTPLLLIRGQEHPDRKT